MPVQIAATLATHACTPSVRKARALCAQHREHHMRISTQIFVFHSHMGKSTAGTSARYKDGAPVYLQAPLYVRREVDFHPDVAGVPVIGTLTERHACVSKALFSLQCVLSKCRDTLNTARTL